MSIATRMPSEARKTKRVDVRLTPTAKEILERASALEGRSLSDFILSSAITAAKQAIADHDRMSLGVRDRAAFVDALLNPPAPTAWALAAAKRFKQRAGT